MSAVYGHRKVFIFFLIVTVLPFSLPPSFAARQNVEVKYQQARKLYYALFSSPAKMKQRRQWLVVIRKFNAIARTWPQAPRGRDAIYTMGLLYKSLYYRSGLAGDKKKAIESFGRVVAGYPDSSLVDDAQRHVGDIRFHDSEYRAAEKAYKHAKKKTPKSKHGVSANSSIAMLKQVRRFSGSDYTRVVLTLSGRTAYRAQSLHNPDRVFIDLLDAKPSPSVTHRMMYKSGLVRSMRMGNNGANVTRVVFDMAASSYHTVTSLADPFRVVIDFGMRKPKTRKTLPAPTASRRYTPRRLTNRIKTIVIDPGHGGKDPGATGPHGLKEKDVTLAIAKKLKTSLERKMRCKVILTRRSDRYLELDDRTVLANSLNADFFISIHVNASPNRNARGIETYFLSPARSKDELETAARENMRSMGGADPTRSDIAYIMSDMASTSKVNDSVALARAVQHSVVGGMRRSYHGIKDKGVKQAMFYVLWQATMPSILVETSFISNSSEERRLRSRTYQARLADSIASGIADYSRSRRVALLK